jgi:hypothetical protein
VALAHFNATFRHRYRLPATTVEALREVPELDDLLADARTIRANGVADASCALIARLVLSVADRYAIGFVDDSGMVSDFAFRPTHEAVYYGRHVLLVNPLGSKDNWEAASRWFREYAGEKGRKTELAGLASEERPDRDATLEMLTRAAAEHRHAIALPPDEGFSARRAAEVGYIYGVPVETLRDWRRTYRAALGGNKPGAPRKNR